MKTHSTGTYETKSWEEKPYNESGEVKLTRVSASATFQGGIEAEATQEYLMTYPDGGSIVSFVGQEYVVGRIGDRSGSFVLQHRGAFEDGKIRCTWFVAPGSGTNDLRGLRGEGGYIWEGQEGQSAQFTLDYELD